MSIAAGHRRRGVLLVAVAAIAVLGLAACATTYVLRPVSGAPVAVSREQGITLTADADAWDGEPYDLPAYLTPIAVTLVNQSGKPVAVSYASFALRDEHGFRYAAIDPFTGAAPPSNPGFKRGRPVPGEQPAEPSESQPKDQPSKQPDSGEEQQVDPPYETQRFAPVPYRVARGVALDQQSDVGVEPVQLAFAGDPRQLVLAHADRGEVLLARRGRSSRGGRVYRSPRGSGRVRVYGGYRGGHRGRRYYVTPRVYGWGPAVGLGFYYDPWTGPWYYPPRYHTYVYSWSPRYYSVQPTRDVLQQALPEGVLESGQVSGFLYFQPVAERARKLTLVWDAATPRGKRVARMSVAFTVVPE